MNRKQEIKIVRLILTGVLILSLFISGYQYDKSLFLCFGFLLTALISGMMVDVINQKLEYKKFR